MAKPRKGHKKGDIKRMVRCNFCGEMHRRRSAELRECRKHRGSPPDRAVTPSEPRRKKKPPRAVASGNPLIHLVVRRYREGMPPAKIASQFDISKKQVKQIIKEVGV